jgi:hypothetical protein
LTKCGYNGYTIPMKETKIRGIPEDVWADILRMAGEDGTSANRVMLEAVTDRVNAWRKSEKKRLAARMDELNQERLI